MDNRPVVFDDTKIHGALLTFLATFCVFFIGFFLWQRISPQQPQTLAAAPVSASPSPIAEIIASPTASPEIAVVEVSPKAQVKSVKIACLGPDGKTSYVTQSECDKVLAFWKAHPPTGVGGASISVSSNNSSNSDANTSSQTSVNTPSPSPEEVQAAGPTVEPQPSSQPSSEPTIAPSDEPQSTTQPSQAPTSENNE